MTDTRIVTTAYRHKPPPRKRKAVAIAGPGTGQRNAELRSSGRLREATTRERDANTAATPAQPRAPAVGPDKADAPDACDASATPFQTAIAPAPVLRLVSARPRLAGSGSRPVIR
jgi:hypothetical protein